MDLQGVKNFKQTICILFRFFINPINYKMRSIIITALILIGCTPMFAQERVHNLSKLSEENRNAYLLAKSKEVIMNFGPEYYREYGEPEIVLDVYAEGIKHGPRKLAKYKGFKYYTVTFRYDQSKELFDWNYAAEVEILEKTGEPICVSFGCGYGIPFDEYPYEKWVKNGIKPEERIPFYHSNEHKRKFGEDKK